MVSVCDSDFMEDQNPGIQGSQRPTARCADGGGGQAPLDSCILVFVEAALAADLITAARSLPGRLR